MRRFTTIDNEFVLKHGLTLQEAYLFVWFYSLPSWASSITYNDKIYFFASKNKACEDLPILTTKPDTMYRYYKKLEKYGFVEIIKLDGKDYISLTSKAKQYNESDHSDNHPKTGKLTIRPLGQLSENNSDNHPTYRYITNIDSYNILPKRQSSGKPEIDFNKLLNYINQKTGRSFRKINEATRKKYKATLKQGYTNADIKSAIDNAIKTKNNIDNNFQYLTPEYFSRTKTLDMYCDTIKIKNDLNFTPPTKSKISKEEFIRNPYND